MVALGAQCISPALPAALQAGEPLGNVDVFRYPGGVWRRYDQMLRFPKGFLVFDATAAHIGRLWTSNQFNDLYMQTQNGQPAMPQGSAAVSRASVGHRRKESRTHRKAVPR